MINWMASSRFYKLFRSVLQMNKNVQDSSQALGNTGLSHQDIAVEMVRSLPQVAHNASDRLPSILPNQKLENQKMTVSAQGEKRRVRESLRARRLNRMSKLKSQLQQMKEEQHYQCQVCSEYCSMKEIKVFGDCGHKYCQTCLHQHINNSINSFKIVSCLEEDCPQSLDISSPHIRALKLPLQQKYYKIRVFLNLSKDQDIRMCPSENCEGFIKMSDEKIQCPICCVSFCRQCLLPRHSGSCDQNGVLFFEDNYLFKRCDKCKMVLEKNQGCNHMTCKCGYQFCYVCGKKWVQNHKCKPAPAPVRAPVSAPVRPPEPISAPVPVPPASLPIPAQALPPPPANRVQLPLPVPIIIQPISLPSISVALNSQQRVVQQRQLHQTSNNALDPPISNPAPTTEITCQNYFSSTLKTILIALVVLPVHLTTIQFCFPIFFCIILPILISIFFLFYSLIVAMQTMIQNQSCLKIALLNILLYLYYVLPCYCRKWGLFFREKYCNKFLTLQFLFPISTIISSQMKECLF